MQTTQVYVLCSQYSKACSEFLRTVSEAGLDSIVPIYVDNPTARRIVRESALDIQTLPCVLGSVNGYMATYEGHDAFAWLAEVVQASTRAPGPGDALPPPEEAAEHNGAHVNHKLVDSKSVAERMRAERETDDDIMFDRKRKPRDPQPDKVFGVSDPWPARGDAPAYQRQLPRQQSQPDIEPWERQE